jgi:hypothetical protein
MAMHTQTYAYACTYTCIYIYIYQSEFNNLEGDAGSGGIVREVTMMELNLEA